MVAPPLTGGVSFYPLKPGLPLPLTEPTGHGGMVTRGFLIWVRWGLSGCAGSHSVGCFLPRGAVPGRPNADTSSPSLCCPGARLVSKA